MTGAGISATSCWAVVRGNLKSFVLDPKKGSRAQQRSTSSTTFDSVENEDVEEPVRYKPATCTGFGELPLKTALVILLLWSPRFSIPWIAELHKYDYLVLANPEQGKPFEKELLIQQLILFSGKCGITMFVSFIAGVLNTERSTYMVLLVLYTSCPVAGGYVNTVLRYRLIDSDLYTHWFWHVALMRWTMAIPFIFFPVQLGSIFYEEENMSRQAHYNWVGFFAFLEFLNAYLAFCTVPGECPTTASTKITVWIAVGLALYTVALLTIVFLFSKRALGEELVYCFNSCVYKEEEPGQSETSWSTGLKTAASYVCIFIPVIYAFFVLAVLQRYIRNVEWEKPKSLSATGIVYMGRAIGVLVMMTTLTVIRRYGKKITRIRLFRSDVLALGGPHLFTTIAFFILFGRYTAQLPLNEGDVIVGPTPNDTKPVLIFFNLIYKNRTVCVSSEHFRSLQVRPFGHATQTLPPGLENIMFTVTPEPESVPSVATTYEMNITQGGWVAFSISLSNNLSDENDAEVKQNNYHAKPRVNKLKMDQAKTGESPQVFIFNTFQEDNKSYVYHFVRPDSSPSGSPIEMVVEKEGNVQLWNVGTPGNWSVTMNTAAGKVVGLGFDFRLNNNSVYFLANYLHKPLSTPGDPLPMSFKLFKITEVAGPNDANSNKHLRESTAVRAALILAGMAAGGLYVGVIYMFWIERFISTTMRFTILSVLIAVAEQVPKIKRIDENSTVSPVLCELQVIFTVLHFVGALVVYRPESRTRARPD